MPTEARVRDPERSGKVHWRPAQRVICGVGRRWPSQIVSSTRNPADVTCGGCKRTIASIQRKVNAALASNPQETTP